MKIRFTKAKHKLVRPIQKAGQKSVLQRLNEYLERYEPETVKILYRNLDNLQNVYTYKELRDAYFAGQIPPDDFQRWQTEYAHVIDVSFRARWELAAEQAAEEIKALHPYFLYEPSVSSALEFVRQHGAELVTVLAQEQIDALNAVIGHISGYAGITADQASYIMRPLIGLNRPQAIANANYLRKVQTKYLKDHPNAKPATADRVARQAAARYGAQQHRYRAMMIARTELAFGYNAGHYGATKDAQKQGYIGECKKVWVTAYDERVCEICSTIDGEERGMDELFSIGKQLPPAHPNCRCAVAYEEINIPFISQPKNDIINELSKLKKSGMAESEYAEYLSILNGHDNSDIRSVYKQYADDIKDITKGSTGQYQPSTNSIIFSYPKYEEMNKYGTLAHEYGHFFDAKVEYDNLSFFEIDAVRNATGLESTFEKCASSSDEFLAAIRKDKEHIKKNYTPEIEKQFRDDNTSHGVQDAIDGLFLKSRVKWGHGEKYYNRKYSTVDWMDRHSFSDTSRKKALQKVYKELGLDASNQTKVKVICRQYEAASEAWANIMSAEICGGKDLEHIKEWLPNSHAALLGILKRAK